MVGDRRRSGAQPGVRADSSPSNDYYGGERPGDNLFSDSVVALRADTGERVWHFQTVHHDLWDYDVASPPLLFDWRKDGRTVPAVAIASKTGHLFILDRTTGMPLIPVEERPVPDSDVPGEAASPTQPFPVAPQALAPARLTADQAWGATEADRQWCRDAIGGCARRGLHTALTHRHAGHAGKRRRDGVGRHGARPAQRPADHAGQQSRRGSAAGRARSRRAERQAGRLSGEFEYHPQLATRYGMVRRFLLAPGSHLPCTPPPWGTLAAIRPSTGEVAWQVPLGQLPSTRNQPGLEKSGSIALGGPIATAGGIVFTAGTLEAAIYAFDARPARCCGPARSPRAPGPRR